MDELKIYTLDEVQKITGVSKTTLYRCIKDGRLAAVQMGRKYTVTDRNLRAFLDKGTKRQAKSKRPKTNM